MGTGIQGTEKKQAADRVLEWIQRHRNQLIAGGVAVAVVAGGVWFSMSAQKRKEAFAQRELSAARFSAQAGNLPLAARDLSRLITAYRGTSAADEATLVRARVRLMQGQPELAVAELRSSLSEGLKPHFRAPAGALLGAALEDAGRMAEAGQAYTDAAETTPHILLKGELLVDAGRAYLLAGDTSRATESYRRIVDQYSEAPSALEARVRLGELRTIHPLKKSP